MHIDPETPEIEKIEEPQKKEALPSLQTPTSKTPKLSAWFWVMVAVLVFANLMFLFLSDSTPSDVVDPVQQLDQDADNFERLSFWQQLWQGEDEASSQRKSVFDGLPIDPDTEERAVSLMIDNFSLARPQHEGIRSASVVYEALVEGGITRIMLVFPYQELGRVGPVRSARDYFVDYAEEYGGIYVHAGGSPAALDQLWNSERVYSIEEDIAETGETYSFRDVNYDAPHNLFFDLLLTKEWAEDRNYDLEETEKEWCFSSNDQAVSMNNEQENLIASGQVSDSQTLNNSNQSVSLIELDFSNDVNSSYYVQFQYDAEDESYRRFYRSQNREAHIDQGESLQVAPQNLIVQVAPSYLIEGDEKERLAMQHTGTGDGFYYSKGEKSMITWEKENLNSVTNFYDEAGNELCVNPGQTWVAVVDTEDLVIEDAGVVSRR